MVEYAPYAGRSYRMTSSELRKARNRIIKGGKVADELRELSDKHHAEHEVPAAEKEMKQTLESLEPKITVPFQIPTQQVALEKKISWWQKFLSVLRKILLP